MTTLAATELMPTSSSSPSSAVSAGCLSDPPRLLSQAGLEWLLDTGLLSPGLGSPLEPFSGPIRVTSLSQRQRAALELGASFPSGPAPRTRGPVFRTSWLGRALAVLEYPEARVRVATATPDRPPAVVTFYLRGGLAVVGHPDREGFYVDRPISIVHLVERLAKDASNGALPAEMSALCVLPEVYELANVLWQRRGKGLAEPISRGELESLLEPGPNRGEAARELLAVLLDVGLLTASGARFYVSEGYRCWLELVWSGHILEIERMAVAAVANSDTPHERALFAGPANQRVLCEDVMAPAGEPLVVLSRLSHSEIRDRLLRLLSPRLASSIPTTVTLNAAGMDVLAVSPRGEDVN